MSESFEQDPLAKKIHDLFLMKTKKKIKNYTMVFHRYVLLGKLRPIQYILLLSLSLHLKKQNKKPHKLLYSLAHCTSTRSDKEGVFLLPLKVYHSLQC